MIRLFAISLFLIIGLSGNSEVYDHMDYMQPSEFFQLGLADQTQFINNGAKPVAKKMEEERLKHNGSCIYAGWPSKASGQYCLNPKIKSNFSNDPCSTDELKCQPILFGENLCVGNSSKEEKVSSFKNCKNKFKESGKILIDVLQKYKNEGKDEEIEEFINFINQTCSEGLQQLKDVCQNLKKVAEEIRSKYAKLSVQSINNFTEASQAVGEEILKPCRIEPDQQDRMIYNSEKHLVGIFDGVPSYRFKEGGEWQAIPENAILPSWLKFPDTIKNKEKFKDNIIQLNLVSENQLAAASEVEKSKNRKVPVYKRIDGSNQLEFVRYTTVVDKPLKSDSSLGSQKGSTETRMMVQEESGSSSANLAPSGYTPIAPITSSSLDASTVSIAQNQSSNSYSPEDAIADIKNGELELLLRSENLSTYPGAKSCIYKTKTAFVIDNFCGLNVNGLSVEVVNFNGMYSKISLRNPLGDNRSNTPIDQIPRSDYISGFNIMAQTSTQSFSYSSSSQDIENYVINKRKLPCIVGIQRTRRTESGEIISKSNAQTKPAPTSDCHISDPSHQAAVQFWENTPSEKLQDTIRYINSKKRFQ